MIYITDELSHYGVRGMKWGVRKQQPISIGRRPAAQSMSLEQRKAVRRARIKKAAKVGAVVAGAALATYGVYKLHQVRNVNMAAVQKYLDREGTWIKQGQRYAAYRNRPAHKVITDRNVSVKKTIFGPQLTENLKKTYSGGISGVENSTRVYGYKGTKFYGTPNSEIKQLAKNIEELIIDELVLHIF